MLVKATQVVGVAVAALLVSSTVASAAPHMVVEKSETLKVQIDDSKRLKFSGFAGDITVDPAKPGAEPGAVVDAKWNLHKPELRVNDSADELHLSLHCGRWRMLGWCGNGNWNATVSPKQELKVSSAAGNVQIGPRAADTSVRTAAGDIRIGAVEGDVRVRTSAGSVEIGRTEGDLNVRTSAGSVEAVAGSIGNVSIKTAAGDVRLVLPPGEYQINAHSSMGDVVSAFPNSPNAERVIDLKASAGDVTIVNAANE